MKRARRPKPVASHQYGLNTNNEHGKPDSQSVLMALNSFTEVELNLLATTCFILVVVCVVGVVSIYFQCRRLQRTLHERLRTTNKLGQQQRRLSSRRLVAANSSRHYNDGDDDLSRERHRNQDAKRMLKAEVEAMRQIQDQVREQATMLKQFCALRFRDPTQLSSSVAPAASALPLEEEPPHSPLTSTTVRQRRPVER